MQVVRIIFYIEILDNAGNTADVKVNMITKKKGICKYAIVQINRKITQILSATTPNRLFAYQNTFYKKHRHLKKINRP